MKLNRMMDRGTRLVLGLFLLGGISACDLNDVLQVSDPSRFTDEALDNINALDAVANGVRGNFDFSIDGIVIYTGLLSDELMHTGTWSGYEDADKGRMRPPPGIGFNIASDVIRLRADKAAERFIRVLGESEANSSDLMATVKTIRGWQNIMKAETQCEDVIEGGGPAVPDDQVWGAAVSDLQAALVVAQAAGSSFWTDMAHAGLARSYLNLGDYDNALTNAQAVSNDFVYYAQYSESSSSNSLVTLNHYSENKAAGLDSRRWAQVDTMDPSGNDYYVDPWTGEHDPRVPLAFRAVSNRLGVDGITKFFSQDKYYDRGSDIPVTHKNEMLLIEAEVYWSKGQFQTAIDRMNQVRAKYDLSPLTNPGTSQGVLDMLLEERFATLFLEGQRANDLYRFNLFPSVIGSGFNTKFPMNGSEMINNPNIPQPRSCPVVS
jgi:hypothetical protein